MSRSLRTTRGRSASNVIPISGSVEKVRMNVKGVLFESEKIEGAESVAVILGGAEGEIRVVKVVSLSPTSVQEILVGDGVGICSSGYGDRASIDSSLVDSQCVMETV